MKIYILIFLIAFTYSNTQASVSPVSGQFSNFTKSAKRNNYPVSSTTNILSTKINLIVTKNILGHQFFLQCSNGNELGFGTVSQFNTTAYKTTINAGQFCPFKKAEVEFDYDWVIFRANNKVTLLYQGSISVPVVE